MASPVSADVLLRGAWYSIEQAGYQNTTDSPKDYLTHYNRALGKCFIRITHRVESQAGKAETTRLMMMMIYDAVDGNLIGSNILEFDGQNFVPKQIMDETDDKQVTPKKILWFANLMTQ